MKNLESVLKTLEPDLIATLCEWLKIPSLKSEALPNAPFGAELRKMLDVAIAKCKEMGFETCDYDGYIADAKLGEGSDEDALAILAHLDLVPVGDGWTKDPFGGTISDGKIYGRGAIDDKGPLLSALFALYAVKLAGIPLKRKITFMLGCDEESGMDDVKYYAKHAVMPKQGFSPDAVFPLINIEKGMVGIELKADLAKEGLQLLSFNVGERSNVVPGSASVVFKGDGTLLQQAYAFCEKKGWEAVGKAENGMVHLTVKGINGHAAMPHLALNAIGIMLLILKELGAQGALKQLADQLGFDYSGKGLGIQSEDTISGPLTCNLGIIRSDGQTLKINLDIRYPILLDGHRLKNIIADYLPGFNVVESSFKEPHYVPESSVLVQSLLDAYHQVTGLEKKALAIGGGTYGRMLQEGVAFGANFPGETDMAHQADEYISIKSLIDSFHIYAYAIAKLAG